MYQQGVRPQPWVGGCAQEPGVGRGGAGGAEHWIVNSLGF